MDLGCSVMYQLATAFSRDMMNDLARVVSSPSTEAITISQHMTNLRELTLCSTLAEVLLSIEGAWGQLQIVS
jgi:hypothetical protein